MVGTVNVALPSAASAPTTGVAAGSPRSTVKLPSTKIDQDTQKVYDTGVGDATLSDFQKADDGAMVATLNATGNVGPKINEDQIKEQVKGKKYGEVQQSLEAQDGIKEVDVQFSFFWVRTVPNNTDKVTVEFKVADE